MRCLKVALVWLLCLATATPLGAIERNVASQKLTVVAIDSATGRPKTGDSANITCYVSKDDGSVTVLGDSSATEADSTNAKGVYVFDLTQSETNAVKLVFTGKSSTSGIDVIPQILYTTAPNASLHSIDSNGRVDVIKLAGTTQTARDVGASVLLSAGTGTGQLDFTSGRVKADTVYFGGSAGTFASGRPEVNTTHAAGTAWGSGAITAASIASDAITAAKIAADAITDSEFSVTTDVLQADMQRIDGTDIVDGGAMADNFANFFNNGNNSATLILDAVSTFDPTTNTVDVDTVGTGAITAASIAADAIGASEVAAGAVDEIWDEPQSGHATAGTFGLYLDAAISGVSTGGVSAATIADAVWDEATSGHTTSGTFGEQAKTDIDAILDDTGTSGVLISSGTGSGQLSISSGIASVNATQISGDSTAADNLESYTDGTSYMTVTPRSEPRVWYVDDGGNDSNDGKTVSTPFLTLSAANTAASPGDTVIVGPGAYSGAVTLSKDGVTWQGQDAADCVIISSAAATVTVSGNYVTLKRLTIVASAEPGVGITAASTRRGLRLENLIVSGTDDALACPNAKDIYINQCAFTATYDGANLSGCNGRVLDSSFLTDGNYTGDFDKRAVLASGNADMGSFTGEPQLIFENCLMAAVKTAGSQSTQSLAAFYGGGSVLLRSCRLMAKNTSSGFSGDVVALLSQSRAGGTGTFNVAGRVVMEGGVLYSSTTGAGTARDAWASVSGSEAWLSGVNYDSTKAIGSVYDTRKDWVDGKRLDLILDARASQTSVDTVDTVADAIQVVTDKIATMLTADGGNFKYTDDALQDAPSGGGGGGFDADDAALVAARIVAARGDYYPPRAQVWVLTSVNGEISVKDDKECTKAESVTRRYYIDFAGVLGRNEAIQAINSLTVSDGSVTITADSEDITGNLVYAEFSGGTGPDACTIEFDVTGTNSPHLTGSVVLNIP